MSSTKLPTLSGRDLIKILTKLGFSVVGRKGSHVRLKKKTATKVFIVLIPDHRAIKRGTLGSILRQAGLSRDSFLELIKK